MFRSNPSTLFTVCKNKKLDVYFVVDKSRSIKDDELETERLVVYGIMKSLGICKYISTDDSTDKRRF